MQPQACMQLALDAAWQFQGLTYPNPAVGCTVTGANGEVIAVAAHERAGGPHAEVAALKQAYHLLTGDDAIATLAESAAIHDYLQTHHNGIFSDCTLYVTLEPCAHYGKTPACAALIATLRPKKVIIAHEDPHVEAAGGAMMLEAAGVEVEQGLLHEKACALLMPFLKWQENRFVVFKWAQRLDGTVDGGLISCEASRRRVHAMRNVCDLLVIGGNTVRTDRPTLDARLVGGKAPDVLIYSRNDDFDRDIPLFDVEDRTVMISDSFDAMSAYRNIMVEGGPGMFDAVQEKVDYYLGFVAPKCGGTIPFINGPMELDIMYTTMCDSDILFWSKGKQ